MRLKVSPSKPRHGQDVGNRFLLLPELSAGGRLMQDSRSDLSFVTGILFYMLTGQDPDVLQAAAVPLVHFTLPRRYMTRRR